jgi:hypothetical protein
VFPHGFEITGVFLPAEKFACSALIFLHFSLPASFDFLLPLFGGKIKEKGPLCHRKLPDCFMG